MIGGIQEDQRNQDEHAQGEEVSTVANNEQQRDQPKMMENAEVYAQEAQELDFSVTSSEAVDASHAIDEANVAKLSLQEFLDLTNIHFMNLTTTKRRRTEKRSLSIGTKEGSQGQMTTAASNDLAQQVKTACCTLPMLELYQHVSWLESISQSELT